MWNDVTIRKIVRNEVYIGNMVQNKTGNLSYKNKKMIKKPKEDWVRVEGTHEPIISLEVWEQACKIDNARARPKRTSSGEISLFGGLLYCLDCTFAMRFNQEKRTFPKAGLVVYQSYMCGNYSRSGKAACTTHTIYSHRLAEIVIADIKQKAVRVENDKQNLLDQVGTRRAAQSQSQFAALTAAHRAADNRRAELERLIESLYVDKVKGKITEDVCARLINQYEAERRDKAGEVQTLTVQIENFQMEQSNISEWAATIRQFKDIESLDRDILLKLIDKIEIGERVIIDGQKHREIRIYYKFVGFIG